MKILRTASLGSSFTGSYKKRVYNDREDQHNHLRGVKLLNWYTAIHTTSYQMYEKNFIKVNLGHFAAEIYKDDFKMILMLLSSSKTVRACQRFKPSMTI